MIVEWLVCLGDPMGDVKSVLCNLIDMKRQARRVGYTLRKLLAGRVPFKGQDIVMTQEMSLIVLCFVWCLDLLAHMA